MLSFDITDKIIRIVRGFESSGKIKIYDAFSIDIPEKSIENGNICLLYTSPSPRDCS